MMQFYLGRKFLIFALVSGSGESDVASRGKLQILYHLIYLVNGPGYFLGSGGGDHHPPAIFLRCCVGIAEYQSPNKGIGVFPKHGFRVGNREPLQQYPRIYNKK